MAELDAQYRHLVENLGDVAFFRLDLQGRMASWNVGNQRLLGYGEDDFIGRPNASLFTLDDQKEKVPERELMLAARDGHTRGTYWQIRRGGTRIFCDSVVTSVRDETGELLGFNKLLRDATERKVYQERLQDLARALEQAQVLLRSLEGEIVFWGAGAERLYGYSKGEALGKSCVELLQTVFPRPIEEISAELASSGMWQGELRHRHKDGHLIVVRSDWALSHHEDRPVVVEANTDITERYLAAARLQASEERFRNVFAQAPVGIASIRSDGRILHVNPAFGAVLGYTPEELIEVQLLSLVDDAYQSIAIEFFQQLVSGLIPNFVAEKRMIGRDGQRVWVRAYATLLREDAEPTHVICTIENIQDRKDAEAMLLQSNEELARFAQVVAHDLQAPLRTIRSYSQLFERKFKGQFGELGDEFLRFIIEGSEGMSELIRALLRYASVGVQECELQTVPVETVIQGAKLALEASLQETDAEVVMGAMPTIRADRVQLTQLFQNLIGNAINYRQSGVPLRVEIQASRRACEWLFAVSDNGIGIPSTEWERIFQPLKRLHGQEIPGTGVGLAICQKIVERHGGRIWVESEVGKGSSFYFTLDASPSET